MKQKLFFFIGSLCLFGCNPNMKFTTHEEYTETMHWSHEKGIVKDVKASAKIEWEPQ
jgi:hypothetical protein